MELSDFRRMMDEIDAEFIHLLQKRTAVSLAIGEWKKKWGLPIRDTAREDEKIAACRLMAGKDLEEDAERLFRLLMKMSRERQGEPR